MSDEKDLGGLDGEVDNVEIVLKSKDGKEYTVVRKYAFVSTLVKTGLENDRAAKEIPVPGVEGKILEKVVEYMKFHQGKEAPLVEKPLRSKKMKEVCKEPWDATFIDGIGEDRQTLYDVILAANYMDIKALLHLGCAKVASLIKGQPLEKIKEILDPKNKGSGEDKKTEK
ncbi:hypothetical protein AAMO2058_000914400 [Amorphochlora amoebiformis]|uniref:SKP1 component POZ domain-containing protein n=1 Tax=Amorphochlora amoebiformis TaxID=1561963 RepID=A0A7S0H0Y3_9EUKA|mmetsp:Transcript_24947/g.39428  ORF Transcript_24947/g.39428 Transcript_24947/m.39428 type:complete len:170 (+) Transcript_24947:65-574(+)|eukprot:1391631-Amorphochlora_amoeboformis.AAC.1